MVIKNMSETIDETKEIIIGMLKENTGSHFLDSGGAYGRNWEKNQAIDFEKVKPMHWDKFGYLSVDLFHFLWEKLVFDEKMNNMFYEFANQKGNERKSWYELITKFKYTSSVTNTYNYPDSPLAMLSQIIQFATCFYKEEEYIILQIHNGCDARGGYTAPKAFKVVEDDFDLDPIRFVCSGCGRNMEIDGSHWNGLECKDSKGYNTYLVCSDCGALVNIDGNEIEDEDEFEDEIEDEGEI